MANLLTDLQAWPIRHAAHPPKWNGFILRQSLAHRGFAVAWSRGTLRNSVISAIAAILEESGTTAEHMRILLTGHSLGGALSTLASYDIQKAFTFEHIQCYTFGAPYTGNHTYAREYASVVPDTWNVINDHDLVVRMGKMMCLYKRNGHRVIIDSRGSMIVQPGPLDLHVMPGHWNVKYHWLRSYRMALLEVLHYSVQQDNLIELTEMLKASPCLSNYLCTSGQNLEICSQENGEGFGQPSAKTDRNGVSRWLEVVLQESLGHLMESPLVLLARAHHQTSELDRQLFSRSKAMDGGEIV
ncbi:hypothetical protein CVIRNUC_003690 [Coccomyxa viridis]|uniref:Fungal lipase-type domain-containing protein n=1 Tax=Coccomyxa viridis TaxID=1274662 RepID=A0AAV1I333_9CHLO|nr:hypothetical protein CVIRNUC_003690 [Coccomyxa viridis]